MWFMHPLPRWEERKDAKRSTMCLCPLSPTVGEGGNPTGSGGEGAVVSARRSDHQETGDARFIAG